MRVAVFGCGQLAQMMAQAGKPLGCEFVFIAEAGEDTRCVDELGKVVVADLHKGATALYEKLGQPQVITVEKEMVDAELIQSLEAMTQCSPPSEAIYIAQNRIREKTFVRDLGINTAEFVQIETVEQLNALPDRMGYPIYIKATESGYDGYNQWRITSEEDLSQTPLLQAIENKVELIAEKHVPFSREISVIASRDAKGNIAFYPLMENGHKDGVLITTIVPAPDQAAGLEEEGFSMMRKLIEALDYVGTLTVECFETDAGLIVNELAPRVHNSGHWSIEGTSASQFENHCRAICGLPLGETSINAVAGMVNMLGEHGDEDELSSKDVFYHDYGKTARPRRKLGHVTVCKNDYSSLKESMNTVLQSLYGDDAIQL